jgi:hypothetical protein
MLSAPAPEVDEDAASEACGAAGYSAAWVVAIQGLVGGERLAADGALVPLRRRGNAWGTCVVALPARQHEQEQREVLLLRGGRAAEVTSPLPGALLPRPPFAGYLLRAGDDTLLMVVVSLVMMVRRLQHPCLHHGH